ncbi:MAG: hypothetical protein ACOCQG_04010 [Candidatus Nanoarchaeia archaeon]
MAKFLIGIMAGSALGYWCGVHYPDAFFRQYLPFDDYKTQEQKSEYKTPELQEFLKNKMEKLCELEKKLITYEE